MALTAGFLTTVCISRDVDVNVSVDVRPVRSTALTVRREHSLPTISHDTSKLKEEAALDVESGVAVVRPLALSNLVEMTVQLPDLP
jgi:hypothetical protein